MNTLFSVIIPTYNRDNFIKTTVDSVLDQTFKGFELIIIDDGSKDNTKSILEGYTNKLTCIYQDNKGVSFSRNRGLEASRGEYIAFLDSDDKWTPDKLEKVASFIKLYPDVKIFHTQELWYKQGSVHNPKTKHKKPTGYIFKNCLKLCSISISTAVVKKELFEEIGSFNEDLVVCEDYDFWIRASSKYPVHLIDKALTIKDGGREDQLSSIFKCKDKFRIKSILNLINSKNLSDTQYQNALEELKKKCKIYSNGCIKRGKLKEARFYLNLINEIMEV